jgi:hypothetical protein
MMEGELHEQKSGRRPGAMQTLPNMALAEDTSGAELASLDLAAVAELLRERGYELVCRFGHVHAAADAQEWHVCLIGDLATMRPPLVLACLEEAIKYRIQLEYVR